MWLQFKPQQIAAGAAYLAAKSLNMDLTSCQNLWQEFQTPPSVLKGMQILMLKIALFSKFQIVYFFEPFQTCKLLPPACSYMLIHCLIADVVQQLMELF